MCAKEVLDSIGDQWLHLQHPPDQYTSPPLTLWMVRYFSVISVLILLALAASLIILPLVLPPLPPPPLMLLFVPIAIMLLLLFLAFASADTVAPSL